MKHTTQQHGANARRSVAQKLSITAGAVAALGQASAEATVVYVDDSPVTLGAFDGQGSTANWDVDGANGDDFQLWVRSSTFNSSFYFSSQSFFYSNNFYGIVNFASRSYGGGQALNGRGLVGPGGVRGSALNQSFNVGPTLAGGYQWGLDGVSYRSAARADSNFQSSYGGSNFFGNEGPGIDFVNFQDGLNLLGFRFDSNGDLLYGWAEVQISGSEVTITRWAYESDADTAIHVGTVPEPNALALLGMGAAGVLAMRRKRNTA